ncbi:efflux RND transporter periplasmic adaptor subunit [Myxococcota bacterium]|nr:efflux RND transporter periplasmic adaptor subunit [Myxococcota bacterium]MBU1379525.1 efflux RND transporter periplasmic adaptor subunit [Myxococcota bacterium]MBU1498959.1 efflux RND transporter periplasmic adaptor subunit [Myxococcota bacterium]
MVKRLISIVISLSIFGGIGFLVYSNVQKGIAAKKNKEKRQLELSRIDRRMMVITETVKNEEIHFSVNSTGTIASNLQMTVFSMLPGEIKSLKIKEGDTVKKGEILARLDAWKIALNYRQAMAGVNQAKLNLQNMTINYNRMKTLYEQKAISKSEFERVETGFNVAKQQVDMAQAGASLASASWSDATIKAPMDGTIIVKNVEEGDLMSSAQAMKNSPLVVIADLKTMKIDFHIREKYIPWLKKGLKATVRTDAWNHDFPATVDTIGEMLDPVSKTLKVTVLIDNKPIDLIINGKKERIEKPLKIGMFARINLKLENRGQKIAVPLDCVINRNGFDYVFVYKNGIAIRKIVTTGIEDDKNIEIRKGLEIGENLITVGHRAVFDGQSVRLMKEDPFKHEKAVVKK